MSEAAKAPRFPYVAAALCAACLGAAAWTWMRFSYAWPATSEDVGHDFMEFVRDARAKRERGEALPWGEQPEPSYLAVRSRITDSAVDEDGLVHGSFGVPYLTVVLPADAAGHDSGAERVYTGRLRYAYGADAISAVLNTTASRFHGASIAGLVVGAMGVFVFAVALRHWLGERRRIADEMSAA